MTEWYRTMMACGHTAHAYRTAEDGTLIPCCVVHGTEEVMPTPSLEGRYARCACGTVRPSSVDLAFFEYLGPGSRDARHRCKCGYYDVAHTDEYPHEFEARGPSEHDHFYCGCRGWD